ncbi:MAG: hypothetical protein ACJAZ8_000851 [Planctomycetota bacterium]|jgi:hypothetical protein
MVFSPTLLAIDILDTSNIGSGPLVETLLNLALTLILGQVLAFHYIRFAKVLSNKRKFAPTLIVLAATTMMVITVVQQSLALSLGLVGALSIIRFRTPIKEPEELTYLFLAVAIGLGMGANERAATAAMVLIVLAYMAIISGGRGTSIGARTLLHIGADLDGKDRATALDLLMETIQPHATEVDLRRVDMQEDAFDASLVIDVKDNASIGILLDAVQGAFPAATISVVEADGLD